MPVEIKELVIRAVVSPAAGAARDAGPDTGASGEVSVSVSGPAQVDHDAVVEAAVKEVLRILRASKER